MALAPVGGQGGGTSAPYTVLSQHADLLVQGAASVQKAMTITAQETTYGVVFGFTIPYVDWQADGTRYNAGIRAGWINEIAQHANVLGLSWSQDVNGSGELTDFMDIAVGTPDGAQQTVVSVPLDSLGDVSAYQAVDAAFAQLQAVASGAA